MKNGFYITDIKKAPEGQNVRAFLNIEDGRQVLAYHKSFPEYTETPLADLRNLAESLGIKGMYVKDESYRFGLNAFKVLGGSYAIARWIGQKLNMPNEQISYDILTSQDTKAKLGDVTFYSATDGNHGRGVAWTAQQLQQKSVIHMPKGSSQERLRNIRAHGATAEIQNMNYDECVRLADKEAKETGGVIVQDTAWEGYEEIPCWIMQGYASMALEAIEQLGDVKPTHVFLQAGVGSMAGGVAGLIANYYGEDKPKIIVVEPNKADCIYITAEAKDDELHFVTGDMDTIMAGLACGEPNKVGWDVLTETAEQAVSCPDWVAAEGMRVLGNPMKDDPKVISGESGAATTGFVTTVLRRDDLAWMKEELGLNEESIVLCISTEGDTDAENYRRIVWDGIYPSDIEHTGEYHKK